MHKTVRVSHIVAYPIVFILFYEQSWQGLKFKVSVFSIFSRLGSFPQVSRWMKEWAILELHETLRVSHIVACPSVSFMSEVGKEECSNLRKMIVF